MGWARPLTSLRSGKMPRPSRSMSGGALRRPALIHALDGRRVTNPLGAGRSAGASAEFVSRWKDHSLVTAITAPPAPGTDVKTRYEEVRYLDRDGALIVETTIPGQPNARRVVVREATKSLRLLSATHS